MTALCKVPGCREILKGPEVTAYQEPDEENRQAKEFAALQNVLAYHLQTRHPEHLNMLHSMTNTAGLYFVAKCYESSDAEYSRQVARAADSLRVLIASQFSMEPPSQQPRPEKIGLQLQ